MADELKMWAVGEDSEVEPVKSVTGVKLEDILEETLVRRPEMLESELQLVGRQTTTGGGPLDLLGVDANGRLVVFELKRGALTRDAVTQCIDYGSWLAAQGTAELSEHIASRSGKGGIELISDFEEWYQSQFSDLDDLLPPRLVLVGLGIDERAGRMAQFLSDSGVELAVLTFYGFLRNGETLLARQIEVEHEPTWGQRRRRQSTVEKQAALQDLLADQGVTDLFNTVYQTLRSRMHRQLPDTFDQNKERGTGLHARIAGRTPGQHRAFFNILVDKAGGGLSIRLPRTAIDRYGEPAVEALQSRIDLTQSHGGYVILVRNQTHWDHQEDAILDFTEAAGRSWREQRENEEHAQGEPQEGSETGGAELL